MFIAPIIGKLQAEDLLSKTNELWPVKRKMIKVELIYLPIYLFTLKLQDNKGRLYSEVISIDGLMGEFAFFNETNNNPVPADPGNNFSFKLSEEKAREIANREYRRLLYQNNLKTRTDAKIMDFSRVRQIYYPYWIGYFKRKRAYDFDVIDAVSGGKQGIKMRSVFIALLLHVSNSQKSLLT